MSKNFSIPPIKMAEVFVDGHCVGFLSDVKLSREDDGAFKLEGEWSGYSDVLGKDSLFTLDQSAYLTIDSASCASGRYPCHVLFF